MDSFDVVGSNVSADYVVVKVQATSIQMMIEFTDETYQRVSYNVTSPILITDRSTDFSEPFRAIHGTLT